MKEFHTETKFYKVKAFITLIVWVSVINTIIIRSIVYDPKSRQHFQ